MPSDIYCIWVLENCWAQEMHCSDFTWSSIITVVVTFKIQNFALLKLSNGTRRSPMDSLHTWTAMLNDLTHYTILLHSDLRQHCSIGEPSDETMAFISKQNIPIYQRFNHIYIVWDMYLKNQDGFFIHTHETHNVIHIVCIDILPQEYAFMRLNSTVMFEGIFVTKFIDIF